MEIYRDMQDATEFAFVDVVIEDLDEFAIGSSGLCQLTNADYITRVMAPVLVG
jgi:hypothetical protein